MHTSSNLFYLFLLFYRNKIIFQICTFRRACFSFSLQTPKVFGSHKIEMMEERKQIKENRRIIGLEFLMVAFLTNWVQREST